MEYEKLGSLVTIQKGRKNNIIDSYNEESKRIIQIQDLRNDENIIYTNDDKGLLVNENDILIAWDGANAGLVGFGKKGFLGSTLSMLRLKNNKIYPTYLGRFLNTKFDYFQKTATGATIPHLNRLALEELIVPLPSYADQIRIANVLGKIEKVIQARKNAIDQLDELVKATFYDMFGDPVRNEKGWSLIQFDELINFKRGFDLPTSNRKEGKFALCSSNGVTDRISEFKIKGPGIFTGRSGTIGNVFVIEEDYWPLNTTLYSESFNGNLIYLAYLTRNFKLQRFINGTGVPTLNRNNFNKEYIIDVPIELQNQFAAIAQKIEKLKAEQEKQLLEMEALYASVSHAAFSGTLDLTRIPYDESLLPYTQTVIDPVVIDKKKEESKGTENKKSVQQKDLSDKSSKDVLPSTNEWSKLSFKKIAELITNHFKANYFNSEMLLRFLTEEAKLNVDYFSSKEQKLNLKLENANDYLIFLSDAVTDKNPYLKLEQVFYDAEVENIIGITFTTQDLETLSKKTTQERSGIYFRIKNETTAR